MSEEEGKAGLALGAKLFISCKIGDFQNVMKLLDEVDQMDDADREACLDYTDKKGNTHLHALVQATEAIDDFYEEGSDEKKKCCHRLLDLDLSATDTNNDLKTPFDLCPQEFMQTLEEYTEKKRKSNFRGGSLVAEGATIKSMKTAATALLAVNRFKALGKSEAVRREERRSSLENAVMEV